MTRPDMSTNLLALLAARQGLISGGRWFTPDEIMASRRNPAGIPQDLRAALYSLAVLASKTPIWRDDPADAWLFGILAGWDCEIDHTHLGCRGAHKLRFVADRYDWTKDEVDQLRLYRQAVRAALGEIDPPPTPDTPVPVEGFASVEQAARFLADRTQHVRYTGPDGWRQLIDNPATVDHALRQARGVARAIEGGSEVMARLVLAYDLLRPRPEQDGDAHGQQ